jgi:putative thioredoxin
VARAEVLEVGDADFYEQVLVRSHQIPVVVDFWAPWCGPCRQLAPVLERVADDQPGAFVLAKVNVDESPAVARQYDVRSIPLVVAFRNGQPLREFVGLQSEAAVREFVRALEPSEADKLAAEGEALAGSGRALEAEARFRAALKSDPRHDQALLGLARALGARGEIAEALEALERLVPSPARESEVDRLAAELRLRAHGGADLESLRQRVAAHPDDLDAHIELGRALGARGRHEEALAALLEAVRRNPQHADGAARKAMLDLFELLGSADPLTRRYRRELAQALFR